jgi:hypothetical protein
MNMKLIMNTTLFCMLLMAACDKNQDNEGSATLLTGAYASAMEGNWNVSNVSGGFAGINDDFESGLIRWNFDSGSLELHIVNNETSESLYDGYPTGTYGYSILEQEEEAYLFIEGQEFANISLSGGKLALDGNIRSEGSGADFFILTLQR